MSSSRITYDRASDEVDVPMGDPYCLWDIAFIADRDGNTFDVAAPTPQPTSDSDFIVSDKKESIEDKPEVRMKQQSLFSSSLHTFATPESFKIGASGYEIKFHDNDPLPKYKSTRKTKSTKKSNKSQPKKQKIDNYLLLIIVLCLLVLFIEIQ